MLLRTVHSLNVTIATTTRYKPRILPHLSQELFGKVSSPDGIHVSHSSSLIGQQAVEYLPDICLPICPQTKRLKKSEKKREGQTWEQPQGKRFGTAWKTTTAFLKIFRTPFNSAFTLVLMDTTTCELGGMWRVELSATPNCEQRKWIYHREYG